MPVCLIKSDCCGGSRTKVKILHLFIWRCQAVSVWQACVMSEETVRVRPSGRVEEADKGLIDMGVCCVWQQRRVAFLASNRSGRRQRSCLFAWTSNSICLFWGRKVESETLPFVSWVDKTFHNGDIHKSISEWKHWEPVYVDYGRLYNGCTQK